MVIRGLQWVDSLSQWFIVCLQGEAQDECRQHEVENRVETNHGCLVWDGLAAHCDGFFLLSSSLLSGSHPNVVVIVCIRIVDNKEKPRNRLLLNWI